ncbi:putative DNA alkylation repair enzyme (modular protein) [Desulfosarcina cetonica]|uniref:DNA alkylation repair protein n=1 Tax=Desulfosarcina cetonica TaxID=90730 RepID=UPI0009F92CB0|nr:DNA alkylation repair protein [Desulfosarcina cetonica]VTR65399.1 putative DNA alkylation repair enzyme (modular protein) [Desulfosarcina cetonica]
MGAEQKRPLIGVGIIVVRDGRVLLGKRKSAHGAGTWQFPGGHLEFGESIEACARRELSEETGLTISRWRLGPFTNDIFEKEQKHYVTLFVIAETTEGEPIVKEPHKCERWDWFPWSAMPKPHFLPIVNLLRQNFSIAEVDHPADGLIREMATMANEARARQLSRFFKTGPGEYGEGDRFIGIKVPQLRQLAKRHAGAGMTVIETLLCDPVHEHRQLALFLLIGRFKRAVQQEQSAIVDFYLAHTRWINSWDLVDCSAHVILGAFLLQRERSVLYRLARSTSLWERRIAIVATFQFIRAGEIGETLQLAERLLADRADLIHKAVGWMLREAGKRNEKALVAFLETHAPEMPRTMLRYAIERLPEPRRQAFLVRRPKPSSS